MEKGTVDVEELARSIISCFPKLSSREQQLSLRIYRLLAEGQPVSVDNIANALTMPAERVRGLLDQWPGVYYDDQHRIIGYWGLALPEMAHRFEVDGQRLYAWCAWDSLFLPELIQKTARVESTCPMTKEAIHLTVSPQQLLEVKPADAVMSFLLPDATKIQKDVITYFCHFLFFFSSAQAAAPWMRENDGAMILSMEEAFQLARRKNALQYGDILAEVEKGRSQGDLHETAII